MLATTLMHGDVRAAEQRFWSSFGDNANPIVHRLTTDPAFVERLARFALDAAFVASESQTDAFGIMGTNMFTIADAFRFFDFRPTNDELKELEEVPFSAARLEECKNTHILAPIFARTIRETGKIFNGTYCRFPEDEPFVDERQPSRWILLRKMEVLASPGHSFKLQRQLLAKAAEAIPSVRDVMFALYMHYVKTKEVLFNEQKGSEAVYLRTATKYSNGDRATVSLSFGEYGGLSLNGFPDTMKSEVIGLAGCYYNH